MEIINKIKCLQCSNYIEILTPFGRANQKHKVCHSILFNELISPKSNEVLWEKITNTKSRDSIDQGHTNMFIWCEENEQECFNIIDECFSLKLKELEWKECDHCLVKTLESILFVI